MGLLDKIEQEDPKLFEKWYDAPVDPTQTDPDPDIVSLEGLNVPALIYFLETFIKNTGRIEHQATRDDLSCAIFDAFSDPFDNLTVREQVATLVDCALAILAEAHRESS